MMNIIIRFYSLNLIMLINMRNLKKKTLGIVNFKNILLVILIRYME